MLLELRPARRREKGRGEKGSEGERRSGKRPWKLREAWRIEEKVRERRPWKAREASIAPVRRVELAHRHLPYKEGGGYTHTPRGKVREGERL